MNNVNVYLKAMRLINCQSHKDTTLSFSNEKLNVIIADNNVGKSVIFKMLKITATPKAYNREYLKDIIRHGCDYARVAYSFSNGDLAVVNVTLKGVTFHYRSNGSKDFMIYNEPPEKLLKNLGFLIYDNFVVNVIDTDQDLFLVSSDGSCDAKILHHMTTDKQLEELQDKVVENKKIYSEVLDDLEEILYAKRSVLRSVEYVDVESLSDKINKSERLIVLIEQLISMHKYLSDIRIALSSNSYHKEIRIIDLSIKFKSITKFLENMVIKSEVKKDAYTVLEMENKLLHIFNSLCNFRTHSDNCLKLDRNRQVKEEDVKLLSRLDTLCNSVEKYKSSIKECEDAESCIARFKKELMDNSKIVKCSIYGEVYFDGEKCLPVSE